MAPHSSTLAWKNPMDGGAWWAAVHGVVKSRTRLRDFPFTFHFHALEKEMATHSIVLAWRILGTGEPGGLPSMGSHRVGHDWSDLAAMLTRAQDKYPHWSINSVLLFIYYRVPTILYVTTDSPKSRFFNSCVTSIQYICFNVLEHACIIGSYKLFLVFCIINIEHSFIIVILDFF